MNALEGQPLGEFKLLTKVGQGGMGTVYLAEQPALNRRVAVKVLLPELAHDPEFPKRFKREAMLAASINNPGIVQVYAAGEADGVHYIAMEYVDGESLQRRLEREGRLKVDDALDIVTRLAQALDYAWQKTRLIHRDIKPSNVLISTEGDVKLADFGMAKNADCDSNLTATGMPIGTPLYISPEQARCTKELDFTTDIYSLGCTLYHLLCGRAPYNADASFAVMLLHVTEPPPSILQHMPDCPPAIVKTLARMLAKDSSERHASYAELVEELRRARTLLTPQPPKPTRRTPALVGLTIVASLAWLLGKQSSSPLASSSVKPARMNTASGAVAQKPAAPPSDDPFIRAVAALPAEAQAQRVIEKLKELNPDFDPSTATFIVEGSAVTMFGCSIVAIANLSPVRALTALKRLRLGQNGQKGILKNLEMLRGLSLTRLDCHNTPITDLEPLRGMPLTWLVCSGTDISDLLPLAGAPLEGLAINDTGVTDLVALRGKQLKTLNCGATEISDLSPLLGMPLIDMNCSRSPVRDLRPLAEMSLKKLVCSQTSITDLSPLRGMPLTEIECDYIRDRDADILRSIHTLERINGQPAREFWAGH